MSWELLWLVCVVALVIVALHAMYMATRKRAERPSAAGKQVKRHELIDRVMHWVMAISIIALVITGVLPIIGIEFAWLTLHWISGLILTAAVLYHIVRSVLQKDLMAVWISADDFKEPFDENIKPGKYSLAQKGMHAAVTIATLLVIVSGLFMFAMIDTPWWDRTNALSESTLGWMFFIHGLSTLGLIALIVFHLYFTLRPEKLFYLRSMVKGWISEEELSANHDPERWVTDEST
ncbi:MAG: cytochrome b/b6 domain-containing protein [Woeseiaceae bacterium]|nr:cytochrome b/b6 domain-containing protein [Woeseiaceae bacterium]